MLSGGIGEELDLPIAGEIGVYEVVATFAKL